MYEGDRMTIELDTAGFLSALDQLKSRFTAVVDITQCEMNEACEFDTQLIDVAYDVFGNTGWSTTIFTAPTIADKALIAWCTSWFEYCETVVRNQGLCALLYALIDDAGIAIMLQQPAQYMPPMIRSLSHAQLLRRVKTQSMKRFGSIQQRQEDMREFMIQAYRFAAYSLLRWGSASQEHSDTAPMLMNNPGYGMCMLKEHPHIRQRTNNDVRYRRVIDYIHHISAQGDFAFACHVGALHEHEQECEREHTFTMADARYIYDAQHLIEAYETLWSSERVDIQNVLDDIEYNRAIPDVALWDNPIYLQTIADSLMGACGSMDLVQGFASRNRAQFDIGVHQLRAMCAVVDQYGVGLLPMHMLQDTDAFRSTLRNLGTVQRTMLTRQYYGQIDDMVSVALHYVPDISIARDAALAIFHHNVDAYCSLIMQAYGQQPQMHHNDSYCLIAA